MEEGFKNYLLQKGITEEKYLGGDLATQAKLVEAFEKSKSSEGKGASTANATAVVVESSAEEHIFFRVNAQIKNSKLKKGIRAWVYEIACSHGGFYEGDKSTSIYYVNDDLYVRILFETTKECVAFINKLDEYLAHFQLTEPMQFDRTQEKVHLACRPLCIYRRDYSAADTDSENYSVAITRITHISGLTHLDRSTEFQMLEDSNLEDFVGLDVYKCHLRSQSYFPADKDNINNWLWMSWTLRQRFDGLHSIDKHRVPQIAIRLVGIADGVVEIECGIEWYRVDVAIECPEADIFAAVKHRIKEGMIVDEQRKEIITWVFVQDPTDFRRCLTYKYNETREIWKRKRCVAEVTADEASQLRRSVRIALGEG